MHSIIVAKKITAPVKRAVNAIALFFNKVLGFLLHSKNTLTELR